MYDSMRFRWEVDRNRRNYKRCRRFWYNKIEDGDFLFGGNMKKLLKILSIVLVLVVAFSIFTACEGENGQFKVVIIQGSSEKEYTLDNTGGDMTYLVDAFAHLQNDENSGFTYTMNGTYLTSVNGYTPNSANNEFWAIYTDLELDGIKYYDLSWGSAEYEGVLYGSASVGVTQLQLNKGTTYIIKLSTW